MVEAKPDKKDFQNRLQRMEEGLLALFENQQKINNKMHLLQEIQSLLLAELRQLQAKQPVKKSFKYYGRKKK